MTVIKWHNVFFQWLVLWTCVVHFANGLLQNCTVQYRPNLMCDIEITDKPCPPLNKVPQEWPPPPPINFTLGTYMDDWRKDNRSIRYLVPGLMMTWKVPQNIGTISIRGFELSIIPFGGEQTGKQWCVRMNFTGPIDDLQTQFKANLFPVSYQTSMTTYLYSLPKPDSSLDEHNYVKQFVKTPSYINADHPVSSEWVFGLNHNNDTCKKEVTCSFTIPPKVFKFTKVEVKLVEVGAWNSYAKTTVTLPSHRAVFEGVPPGIYEIFIDIVDEKSSVSQDCLCQDPAGKCKGCIRTKSGKFSMGSNFEDCPTHSSTTVSVTSTPNPIKTDMPDTSTPIKTDMPDTSTPNPIKTDMPNSSSPNFTTLVSTGEVIEIHEDGTWKYFVPLVGVLIGIGLLVAAICFVRKRKSKIKCWGKNEANVLSDKPKPPPGSTNNNTVVEADPVLRERLIYLVYTDDNRYHQRAVKLLAKYLNKRCNCSVRYPAWCLQDIQAQGPINWVIDSIQKADYVLIINSEGAFNLNQAQKENNPHFKLNDSPMGDIFTPAIKNIIYNVYKESAFKKYIMVQFHYSEEKFQIREISAGNKYTLMKHFGELLCHIHELNPERPGENSQLLPLRPEDHDLTLEGSELQQAIDMAATFTKNHPNWFNAMYGSEEEMCDSGLSSLPLDSFPDHLRERIQRECKENLHHFRPDTDNSLPTDLQLTYIPPMTDNDNISITQSQVTFDPPCDLYSVFTDIGLYQSPNILNNELGGHPVHAVPLGYDCHPYLQPQISTGHTDSGRSSQRSTTSQPDNRTPGLFNLTQHVNNSIPTTACDSISMAMGRANDCTSLWEEELARDCQIPVLILDDVSVDAMSV